MSDSRVDVHLVGADGQQVQFNFSSLYSSKSIASTIYNEVVELVFPHRVEAIRGDVTKCDDPGRFRYCNVVKVALPATITRESSLEFSVRHNT